MNKEQINSDKKVLASLEAEYNRVRRVTDSIRAFTTDLNFEDLVPDSQERCLMVDELQAYDYIRTNLMNRIRFYRHRIKVNSPQPWEIDKAVREQDEQHRPVCGDGIATHHCGLDAIRLVPYGDNLDQIIGARVRLFHAPGHKCEECPYKVKSDGSACKYHKVELISGHFICLTPNPIITE